MRKLPQISCRIVNKISKLDAFLKICFPLKRTIIRAHVFVPAIQRLYRVCFCCNIPNSYHHDCLIQVYTFNHN